MATEETNRLSKKYFIEHGDKYTDRPHYPRLIGQKRKTQPLPSRPSKKSTSSSDMLRPPPGQQPGEITDTTPVTMAHPEQGGVVAALGSNTPASDDERTTYRTIVSSVGLLTVAKEARARQTAKITHIDDTFWGLFTYLNQVLEGDELDVPIDGGLSTITNFIDTFTNVLHANLCAKLRRLRPAEEITRHFYSNAIYDLCKLDPDPVPLPPNTNDYDERMDDSIRQFHDNGDIAAAIAVIRTRMRQKPDAAIFGDLGILLDDFRDTLTVLPNLFPEVSFPQHLLETPMLFHSSEFNPLLDSGDGESLEWLANMRDAVGSTLLHELVADPTVSKSRIERALAIRQDINEKDSMGQTALHIACSRRDGYDVARALLKIGADPGDLTHFGSSSLHYACASGDLQIVHLLLDEQHGVKGVDMNAKDVLQRTPLYYAAARGHIEIVKKLLSMPEVDVNTATIGGATPLLATISAGQTGVALELLSAPGLNLNAADEEGRSAVYLATIGKHARILEKLLTAPHVDPNRAANDESTPVMVAADEELQLLLRHPKINLSAVDGKGMTVLHHAASQNRIEAVQSLALRRDCALFAKCKAGKTAVDYASGECRVFVSNIMDATKRQFISLGKDLMSRHGPVVDRT